MLVFVVAALLDEHDLIDACGLVNFERFSHLFRIADTAGWPLLFGAVLHKVVPDVEFAGEMGSRAVVVLKSVSKELKALKASLDGGV